MKKLIVTFLAVFFSATLPFSSPAAIVYVDLQPDSMFILDPLQGSGSGITLDFNHDGTVDYSFRWDDWGTQWFVHIVPDYMNHAKVLVTGATNPFGAGYVSFVPAGTPINQASVTWGMTLPEPLIADSYDPSVAGTGDRFLPVRFDAGGNVHFGWIRLNFSTSPQKMLIVRSYAYESTPGGQILAGDDGTSTGLKTLTGTEFDIYPNPFASFVRVAGLAPGDRIAVMSSDGRTVLPAGQSADQLDLSFLSPGIYFLAVIREKETVCIRRLEKLD